MTRANGLPELYTAAAVAEHIGCNDEKASIILKPGERWKKRQPRQLW